MVVKLRTANCKRQTADGRNDSPQTAGMWSNKTGATASQGARFPWRLGDRRRRAAHAAVLFFRSPAYCVLWFLPSAVCRLQFSVRSFTTTARDKRQV
ncbi:MAG: hypothetical protein ACK5Y5_06955, partial [Gemmatimonas sp.]